MNIDDVDPTKFSEDKKAFYDNCLQARVEGRYQFTDEEVKEIFRRADEFFEDFHDINKLTLEQRTKAEELGEIIHVLIFEGSPTICVKVPTPPGVELNLKVVYKWRNKRWEELKPINPLIGQFDPEEVGAINV